jgi:hypothetical protein
MQPSVADLPVGVKMVPAAFIRLTSIFSTSSIPQKNIGPSDFHERFFHRKSFLLSD